MPQSTKQQIHIYIKAVPASTNTVNIKIDKVTNIRHTKIFIKKIIIILGVWPKQNIEKHE